MKRRGSTNDQPGARGASVPTVIGAQGSDFSAIAAALADFAPGWEQVDNIFDMAQWSVLAVIWLWQCFQKSG
jgi:hypothetical protein